MPAKIVPTPELLSKMCADYRAGSSIRDISDQNDCSMPTVIRLLRESGVQLRKSRAGRSNSGFILTPEITADIIAKYNAGHSICSIATELKVSRTLVKFQLVKAGITLREYSSMKLRTVDIASGQITCQKCGKAKSPDEYHNDRASSTGKTSRCKDCQRDINREYFYGMPAEDFEKAVVAQENRCAICGAGVDTERNKHNKTLSVDHCHGSGAVRGLLCASCNHGIGYLADNQEWLLRAVEYLKSPPLAALGLTSKLR